MEKTLGPPPRGRPRRCSLLRGGRFASSRGDQSHSAYNGMSIVIGRSLVHDCLRSTWRTRHAAVPSTAPRECRSIDRSIPASPDRILRRNARSSPPASPAGTAAIVYKEARYSLTWRRDERRYHKATIGTRGCRAITLVIRQRKRRPTPTYARTSRLGMAYESLMFSTRLTVAKRPRGGAPDTGWHAHPPPASDYLEPPPSSPPPLPPPPPPLLPPPPPPPPPSATAVGHPWVHSNTSTRSYRALP